MIALLPVIICVVGLIMYMISGNPKLVEVGRMMFWVGLLVTLMSSGAIMGALHVQ